MMYEEDYIVILWHMRQQLGYSPGKIEELKKDLKNFVSWWLIQHAHDLQRGLSDALIRRSVLVEDRSALYSRLLERVASEL